MAAITLRPTSVAAGASYTNPENALGVPDNAYAVCNGARWDNGPSVTASFTFDASVIPAGSTLISVALKVEYRSSTPGSTPLTLSAMVGSTTLVSASDYRSVEGIFSVSVPNPTYANLRDSAFRVKAVCYTGESAPAPFYIDSVWVDVEYTPPEGGNELPPPALVTLRSYAASHDSASVAKPAGLAVGDYMLLYAAVSLVEPPPVQRIVNSDAEFVQLCYGFGGTDRNEARLWGKFATEADVAASSFSVSFTNSQLRRYMYLSAFTGVDPENPVRDAGAVDSPGQAYSYAMHPGIDAQLVGDMLVGHTFLYDNYSTLSGVRTQVGSPDPWTLVYNNGYYSTVALQYGLATEISDTGLWYGTSTYQWMRAQLLAVALAATPGELVGGDTFLDGMWS